jgi:hypothetical protein
VHDKYHNIIDMAEKRYWPIACMYIIHTFLQSLQGVQALIACDVNLLLLLIAVHMQAKHACMRILQG